MKANILVIDDEENIRFTLERFLTTEGHSVTTAGDCKEARERFDKGGIDLIFADISLPDGTGIDLLAEMRLRDPYCPVIMITAYPSAETMQETLSMGAFDYITKPVTQDHLLRSLSRALEYRAVARLG